ncbi:MAG: hypothetical protein ACFFD3_17345 [Candidatus Thorarchaeota archaeon]
MRRPNPESYLILGILLAIAVCSIPFPQAVDTTRTVDYISDGHIEVGFGGPSVTWVTVVCNTTAEIRFMYQNGTWIGTENVLLASVQTMSAIYNFNAEHSTTVIQISSDNPFQVQIKYTYAVERVLSLFGRAFYMIGIYPFNQS